MIKVFDRSVFGKGGFKAVGGSSTRQEIGGRCAIEFRTRTATSQWNPEARFLDGLINDNKDEMYACDPPEHLDDLIDIAIRLDSRMELHRWVRVSFPGIGQNFLILLLLPGYLNHLMV